MQRRATATTRGPNAEERRYVSWVKQQDACHCCGEWAQLTAHHCEGATFKHNKTLVGHWFVIGLCGTCDDVVTHGSRKAFRLQFGPQSKLWLEAVTRYAEETDSPPPEEVTLAIIDWGK